MRRAVPTKVTTARTPTQNLRSTALLVVAALCEDAGGDLQEHKMAKVQPIYPGVTGGWIRKVPAQDRCVGRSVLCGTADTPHLGRGCSDLPVREARMDDDGCPR